MQNATRCECVKITISFTDIQENLAMESSSPTSSSNYHFNPHIADIPDVPWVGSVMPG